MTETILSNKIFNDPRTLHTNDSSFRPYARRGSVVVLDAILTPEQIAEQERIGGPSSWDQGRYTIYYYPGSGPTLLDRVRFDFYSLRAPDSEGRPAMKQTLQSIVKSLSLPLQKALVAAVYCGLPNESGKVTCIGERRMRKG